MSRNLKAALGWTLWQLVARPRSQPPCGLVVDDEIAKASGEDLRDIRSELRALSAAGIPPDTDLGRPNFDRIPYKCSGSHSKSTFYVLKAKPSGWRLYFVADAVHNQIIFLYVVNKKRTPRNTEDYDVCCNRLEKLNTLIAESTACVAPLPDILVS